MTNLRFTKKRLATAILLATGTALTGCGGDGSTPLTCELPQILDEAQTACITPEPTAPHAVDLYLKGGFSGWGAEDTYTHDTSRCKIEGLKVIINSAV